MSTVPNLQGATHPWRFLQEYQPIDGVFDEMLEAIETLETVGLTDGALLNLICASAIAPSASP